MKITYAPGAEDPRLAMTLKDLAESNPDATAMLSVPNVPGSTWTCRDLTLGAPSLNLLMALPLPSSDVTVVGFKSKRSGANTVATITYKLG